MLDHVKASSPHPREDPLSAEMVMTTMDELLPDMLGPSPEFKAELREFVASVARKVAKVHASFGLNTKKKWSKVSRSNLLVYAKFVLFLYLPSF